MNTRQNGYYCPFILERTTPLLPKSSACRCGAFIQAIIVVVSAFVSPFAACIIPATEYKKISIFSLSAARKSIFCESQQTWVVALFFFIPLLQSSQHLSIAWFVKSGFFFSSPSFLFFFNGSFLWCSNWAVFNFLLCHSELEESSEETWTISYGGAKNQIEFSLCSVTSLIIQNTLWM